MTYDEFEKRYQYDPQRDFLARGGFGSVYKAFDTVRKRYVAIKETDVDPSHKFSLLREVELSHEMDPHDNVVRYTNGYRFTLGRKMTDYAVMPYFEAGNLNQVLNGHELTGADHWSIAEGLLQGVAHLHRQGVIHRDLKASNILVEQRDGRWIPKITDFGLSKLADTSASISNTQIGLSIHYAAPEQLRSESILPNVDLWAVGVSLYKVVMGKLPFDPATTSADVPTPNREFDTSVVAGLINRGLTSAQISQIPLPYRPVIEQCLIVDKHERVKTADALLVLLRLPAPVTPSSVDLPPALSGLVPPLANLLPPAPPETAEPVTQPLSTLLSGLSHPTPVQPQDLPNPLAPFVAGPSDEELARLRLMLRRITTNNIAVVITLNLAGASYFPFLLHGEFRAIDGQTVAKIEPVLILQNGEIQLEAAYPAALTAGGIRFWLTIPPVGQTAQELPQVRLAETDWYDWKRPSVAPPTPRQPVTGGVANAGGQPVLSPGAGYSQPRPNRLNPWLIALAVLVAVACLSYFLAGSLFDEAADGQARAGKVPIEAERAAEEAATVGPYRYGIAEVRTTDGRKWYRTLPGQRFDEIRAAHCGRIPARSGNVWCYLNLNGDVVINPHYDDAQSFDDRSGTALVTADGSVYRINRWGDIVK